VRIVIAEDAAVLRDGLTRLLTDEGHEVVAAVSDAQVFLAAVEEHRPDATIVDIRMPPTHSDEGLQAAIAVRRKYPDIGVLVFSQYVETRYAAQLLADDARGVGYLLKERVADTDEFMDALTRVAQGGTALDPEVVSRMVTAGRRGRAVSELTVRERQVLELMAEGRSNTAIATALAITQGGVEKHVANIYAKLRLPPSDDDHRRVLAVIRYLD
jgi:DNA-binding NarL/FixJ family response regulator